MSKIITKTIVVLDANTNMCSRVCPYTDEYKIELRNLNHISESPKQDDVEKPLRSMIAEAKAIGKNIRTYYQDIVFTPQALEACLNQGKFRWWNICNWELTTREQNYFPSISTSSDRPKPEPEQPKYKVGDWVELNVYNNHQGQIKKMFPAGMGELCGTRIHRTEPTFLITGLSGEFHYDTITRKLSPADIVIRIGCLSGTVRRINDIFFCLNPSTEKGWVVPEATIPLAMLDIPTRKLVESLLKAQEEECQ